jgi:hypothetical protein
MKFSLISCGKPTTPVPGVDGQYIAYCPRCDDSELFATRGGFTGVEHCYGCGLEKEVRGLKQRDIDGLILSSWSHWQRWPLLPYNWHEKTEEEKMKILFPKRAKT